MVTFRPFYIPKVQKAFRKSSVVEDVVTLITGEISAFGDSVKVIKEPEITVSTYQTAVSAQIWLMQTSHYYRPSELFYVQNGRY